ncbi:hypothetical protein LMG24235_00934 [Paraburkholderia sabiae]|nr:hypothetical protein LMG24235_00934 [Paraburkholderia sabiae]
MLDSFSDGTPATSTCSAATSSKKFANLNIRSIGYWHIAGRSEVPCSPAIGCSSASSSPRTVTGREARFARSVGRTFRGQRHSVRSRSVALSSFTRNYRKAGVVAPCPVTGGASSVSWESCTLRSDEPRDHGFYSLRHADGTGRLAPLGGGVRCAPRCTGTAKSRCLRLCDLDESELLQRSHAVIQSDLFDNPAVFESKYRRACEVHFPAGRSG